MTRREIMVRAHELARGMQGDYMVRMSFALRQAWYEAKLAQRGNRWEKHGKRRIYFNGLARLYGLEADYYNSGNVKLATLDGERISNSHARGLLHRLDYAKLWYDIDAQSFGAQSLGQEIMDELISRLSA